MNDLVIYFKSSSQLFCVPLNQAKITDVLSGVCVCVFQCLKRCSFCLFLF